MFGAMKLAGLKLWQGLLLGIAVLTATLFVAVWMLRVPATQGQNWVVLSIPNIEFRTNAGEVLPRVVVRVSNVGPEAVDFRLCWFECRARGQKTLLATNRFASLVPPLGPGHSTNLTIDTLPAQLPVGDYHCCGEVLWAERESIRHRWHRTLDHQLNLFDLTKNPRWYARELRQGSAIAGNVEPADYFREMYGKTRSEWLELARRRPEMMRHPLNNRIYYPGANDEPPEQSTQWQAESAFRRFLPAGHQFVTWGMMKSRQSLKPIRFEDELLPDWAQLLDLAASLSSVPESTRQWFSLFTRRTGVDDARTIIEHCQVLRSALLARRDSVLAALAPGSGDSAPAMIHAAWLYALDTILGKASGAETCAWRVQGSDDAQSEGDGGGDITLRRV